MTASTRGVLVISNPMFYERLKTMQPHKLYEILTSCTIQYEASVDGERHSYGILRVLENGVVVNRTTKTLTVHFAMERGVAFGASIERIFMRSLHAHLTPSRGRIPSHAQSVALAARAAKEAEERAAAQQAAPVAEIPEFAPLKPPKPVRKKQLAKK